ncbi:MAG: molybdopterin dinucleotide binding domain-containing protein, partial [Pseudomonadota bacterium]
ADATRLGLAPADLVEVTSPHGRAALRVLATPRVRAGDVFAPIHWTGEHAPTGRIDALAGPATDPVSGQPESKAVPVALCRLPAKWFAFAVGRTRPDPDCAYFARARVQGGWQVEMAGTAPVADWPAFARTLFGSAGEAVTLGDPARATHRVALTRDGRIDVVLFAAPQPVALSRAHVVSTLGGDPAEALAGRAAGDRPDPGPTVCACLDVGASTIAAAIRDRRLMSVDAIGALLGAGTACGSCKPELAALLNVHAVAQAAE